MVYVNLNAEAQAIMNDAFETLDGIVNADDRRRQLKRILRGVELSQESREENDEQAALHTVLLREKVARVLGGNYTGKGKRRVGFNTGERSDLRDSILADADIDIDGDGNTQLTLPGRLVLVEASKSLLMAMGATEAEGGTIFFDKDVKAKLREAADKAPSDAAAQSKLRFAYGSFKPNFIGGDKAMPVVNANGDLVYSHTSYDASGKVEDILMGNKTIGDGKAVKKAGGNAGARSGARKGAALDTANVGG